jgi:hypothetical protein
MDKPESGTGPGASGPPGRTARRRDTAAPSIGDQMNHMLQRLTGALFAGSLVLATLGAPVAALAADPAASDAHPSDTQSTDVAPPGDVMDDGFDGEVVYDPYFISPEPDASPDETPETAAVDGMKGEIARPALTPPATDATGITSGRQGGAAVLFLLAALAALSIAVVALGRFPVARRR